MATKYECDRCHEVFSIFNEISKISYPMLNSSYKFADLTASKDLCTRCIQDLNEFLKPLPKVYRG